MRTPPDILLITLDTTRADHIGAYGDRQARTPRLDRLAAEGVLFERVVAAAPITLPAHVSLLTGLYPFAHGVRNNGTFALADAVPTLATVLHERGYRTAAFVSAFVLDRRYGLARGFDHYDDRFENAARSTAAGEVERRGDRTALAAGEWLSHQAGDGVPLFVWLHLYDPHDPYDPPSPFREAFADRPYDGEIAFDDNVISSLLGRVERLGRLTSTVVAVVGDHGESLGDHDELTHSLFVYESALRVPLILSWPNHLPAGRRVSALARSIDLAPTLLDVAGQPALAHVEGQSLMPLVRGRATGPASAYGETYFPFFYMHWAPLRSIQDDRWKFIEAPSPELYDLSRDSREQTNLAEREPARAAALRGALDTMTGGRAGMMSEHPVDRETTERLAALGYLGAATSGASSLRSEARADPKAMIGVFNRLRRANAAVREGRFAEAETIAGEALERDPQNAFARVVLANAKMEQGRYREAIAAYRAYADLVPTSADAHHRIAICYARLGDLDRALAEEDAALALDPRDAEAHELRGGLLAERLHPGDADQAIHELHAAVDIDPGNAPFRVGLARALIAAQRADEAEAELRRAFELQPDNADAHAAYAAVLVSRGRLDAAVAEFTRALALQPDHDDVRLDLAQMLERVGRRTEAQVEYRRLAFGRETPGKIRKAARDRLR